MDRSRIRHMALSLVAVLTLVVTLEVDAWAVTAKMRRVSVTSSGTEAAGHSYDSAISADGRFVAFASEASNLVPVDTNGYVDIFIRDRNKGTTRLVSLNSGGSQSNGDSYWTSISASGRFVAFESAASNLVGGDTNGYTDVFVRDRQEGTTRRVSVRSDGSDGNGSSIWASISGSGRFVAFTSLASNLVGGDDNDTYDIFVHDRTTRRTRRVSVNSDGTEGDGGSHGPSISADGRSVSFGSDASNLVGDDGNGSSDVFVHDRVSGRTRRVSVSSDGTDGNGDSSLPSISADGRFVAFSSDATNLIEGDTTAYEDVFVRDRDTGTTRRVSVNSDSLQGNLASDGPSISADGRFVVFRSYASNLAYGDTNGYTDIFLHDRETGTTRRVSLNSAGTIQTNANSHRPSISADGRFVAFESEATTLVEGDTNGFIDVFVRGPLL